MMFGEDITDNSDIDVLGDFEDDCHAEYHFSQETHAEDLIVGLNQQRSHKILCDVILCLEDTELPCHRSVLAASSPYFMAMFTGDMRESFEKKVKLSGIEPHIMLQLVDYLYTSKIIITRDNAQQLMSASNLVQIMSVCKACCDFLERQMAPSNCIGIHCFAEAHVCMALSEKARQFTEKNFKEVSRHEEIMLLTHDKLIEFINSDSVDVDSEEQILETALKWVKYDVSARLPYLVGILKCVRLTLIDPYYLFDTVDTEPLLSQNEECKALIEATKRYHILKDRQNEMDGIMLTQPRQCMLAFDSIVLIGGEMFNKTYLNCVTSINIRTGEYTLLKELPFPRCHHGAVVSENRNIYVAGGFNKEKTVLNGMFRYEPTLDKWIRMACMITPRTRFALATLDGYIYAVGGYNGHCRLNTVERYCIQTNTWSLVSPMSLSLSRCQAVGLNGYLYIAGGVIDPGNQSVDLLQRYNPRRNIWETLSPMQTSACLSALVTIKGKIYALGGTTDMVIARDNLTCYDPKTNEWNELSPMIKTRFDSGATVINGKIYNLSGHDGENSFYRNIEEYDPETRSWKLLPDINLTFGRCRFGCVAIRMGKCK